MADIMLRNMTGVYLSCGEKMLLLYRQGGRVVNNTWVPSAGGHFEKEELNDPEAWQSYRVGNPMWISGWCTLGVGVACALTGIGMVVVPAVHVFGSALLWAVTLGAYQADDLNYDTSLVMTVGAGLLYAGEALTFASIPLIAVGGVKKFRAHGIYNEHCLNQQPQPQLELSLQACSNGLGFALRF